MRLSEGKVPLESKSETLKGLIEIKLQNKSDEMVTFLIKEI